MAGLIEELQEHCKEEAAEAAGPKPPAFLTSEKDASDETTDQGTSDQFPDINVGLPRLNPEFAEWTRVYFRTLSRCKERVVEALTIDVPWEGVFRELGS